MPKEYKTPASGKVKWRAKPDGRYYDFECHPSVDVIKRRAGSGTTVMAQTHYYALVAAGKKLQLAPEHIEVELEDE